MADITTQFEAPLPPGTKQRYRDNGDGTYSEVEEQASTGGVVDFATDPQVVAVGAASAQSAAFNAATTRVVLVATTDCWVAKGANPTAAAHTAANFFLPAGVPSYPIKVTPGNKLAVIQDSASGYLSVIEAK